MHTQSCYILLDLLGKLFSDKDDYYLFYRNSSLGPDVPGTSYPQPTGRLTPQPAHSYLDLRVTVFPMLFALGPSLQYDLVLVGKVIRVLRTSLKQVSFCWKFPKTRFFLKRDSQLVYPRKSPDKLHTALFTNS